MDAQIIKDLCRLSAEEKLILGGQKVKKDDYTLSKEFIVNSEKVLGAREIDMRLHTRFIDFPEHGHDYTEFMYVYAGSITHVIEGRRITLQSGDILLLNKHIRHSILRAGEGDVGINFILSNAFLQYVFHNVKNDDVMGGFLSRNFDENGEGGIPVLPDQRRVPHPQPDGQPHLCPGKADGGRVRHPLAAGVFAVFLPVLL